MHLISLLTCRLRAGDCTEGWIAQRANLGWHRGGGIRREKEPQSLLPAVGAFGHEPGPSDANDAPECREDDDGEREGMSCHGESRGARPRLG